MGNIIRLSLADRRGNTLIQDARDVNRDTLEVIRLMSSIKNRLIAIDQAICEIPEAEEREAAEAAASNLRETVKNAFRAVSGGV